MQARFGKNTARHKGIDWADVQAKLEKHPEALWSLNEMEATGGEPDVIGQDKESGAFLFVDCSAESPEEWRSLCYDRAALDSRKENKPKNSAVDVTAQMGVELLTEAEYQHWQTLGTFVTKTSSWIKTPPEVRSLGRALFCDRRYNRVFVYHNGAESY